MLFVEMEIKVGKNRNLFLAKYGHQEHLSQALLDEDYEARIAALSNPLTDEVTFKAALKDVDLRVRQAAENLLKSSLKNS